MKAILEFDLPNDKEEFTMASTSGDLWQAVHSFDQWLRSQIKYNDNLTDEQQTSYQNIREKLYEELGRLNVTLI
jgi:hypothetical protein